MTLQSEGTTTPDDGARATGVGVGPGGVEAPPECASCPPAAPRHYTDLYIRTSWVDAALALKQLEKGKVSGRRASLWVRAWVQTQLFLLGCFIQHHAGKVLFVAVLLLASFSVGLKSATVQSRVDKLWVEEGGRLDREIRYTTAALGEDASGTTHQLLIQTPRDPEASVLHPHALLAHLDVVRAATSSSVNLFGRSWSLKDICYSPSFPSFDHRYIDEIVEKLFPCAIITPLDCFWEGAKLLGPQFPVTIPGVGSGVRWTNLNPLGLLQQMRSLPMTFDFATLEDYMKRMGISTAYQEKPCLDPSDPECPVTSPNKLSGQVPDVGAELTGGCYGLAARFMHWPEELIVGGSKRNKTGHILRARALQTVVQLMSERDVFEYWQSTKKVEVIEWSVAKAAAVLDAWQRSFSEELARVMRGEDPPPYTQEDYEDKAPMWDHVSRTATSQARLAIYEVNAFSTATLNQLLGHFSALNLTKLAAGYLLMLVYAVCALVRWEDVVRSQSGMGLAGVLLVSATVSAGLGLCALLGIPFNASTTQIVPFLALGLGMDDLFLLTHSYAEQSAQEGRPEEQTGEVLKRAGMSVLLGSLSKMGAFFAAALIPIPAMRVLSLQAAVLLLFHLSAMLLVFPALLSLDLRRRRAGRADLACCLSPPLGRFVPALLSPSKRQINPGMRHPAFAKPAKRQAITRALPPDGQHTTVTTVLAPLPPPPTMQECWAGSASSLSSRDTLSSHGYGKGQSAWLNFCTRGCSLRVIAEHHYAPALMRPAVKASVVAIMMLVLAASVLGCVRLRDGLDLTDLVPQGTPEHSFLRAQGQHFGFYSMFAVTQGGFEYPSGQRMLHEYHSSFLRVPSVVRNDDGGLPPFWLSLFRDWLLGLQAAFDRDWRENRMTVEEWYKNASADGVLAYKLLVQTGRVDHPIDKSLLTRARLVDNTGIINPRAFYNYLSAWTTNDALAYSGSQANLRPEPKQWFHARTDDYDLKIPKSQPLHYAQMPFYLQNLGDTEAITSMIRQVREVCQKFEERGLPNYPSGIPFLFWEQYLGLRSGLALALGSALGCVGLAVLGLLLNPWAAVLVTTVLALCALQMLGLLGLLGVSLSAVPSVLTVVGVGMAAQPCLHICLSFLTSIGSRDRRVRLALEHMLSPVTHGAVTTLLGVAMLAFSQFDFIVRYFFYVLLAVELVALANGLIFFPVLLSLFGPSAEVIPHEYEDRISTPTPSPPRRRRRPICTAGTSKSSSSSSSRRTPPPPPPSRGHHGASCSHQGMGCRAASLSTINEESGSWHSNQHEVVVQPELVVQTTTYHHHHHHHHPPPPGEVPESCPGGAQGCSSSPPPPYSTTSSTSSSSAPLPPYVSPHVITTRVTATAKLKVELHTPMPGSAKARKTSTSTSTSASSEDSGDSSGRLS